MTRRFIERNSREHRGNAPRAGSVRHFSNPEDDGPSSPGIITSKDNRWLKLFRAALQGGGPKGDEPIAVEGPKLIDDALRAGLEAEVLLVSESGEQLASRILLAASATDFGIAPSRILRTTDKLFASVAGTESPQGVAALFHRPANAIADLLGTGAPSLIVVLVGVQDPGNVGTAIRSSEAFGATGVIVARGTADPWSPKAVRASAGSALRVPMLRGTEAVDAAKQFSAAKVQIIAAVSSELSSKIANGAPDLRKPTALFIGSEGSGLPANVISLADATMAIPMVGAVESLNAGVAASVLLYEAARQRRTGKS